MSISGLVIGTYLAVLLVLAVYGLHRTALISMYYRNRHRRPRPAGPVLRAAGRSPCSCRCSTRCTSSSGCSTPSPASATRATASRSRCSTTAPTRRRRSASARSPSCARASPSSTSSTSTAPTAPASRRARCRTACETAKGEFILIFDADFVPTPDILERAIHHFTDPKVAHGAVPLGARQPRLLGADRGAGADARRALHHGARRPQPVGPLLQLQRHRRHLAPRRPSPTRAAGSTTR